MIISGFPGVGKTYVATHAFNAVDFESSLYSRGPDWPSKYLRDILNSTATLKLVSTHKEVREALVALRLPFYLVYPSEPKESWLERLQDRSPGLLALLAVDYDDWIDELFRQTGCMHIRLGPGEYLGTCFHG